jgi:hypothetical protein
LPFVEPTCHLLSLLSLFLIYSLSMKVRRLSSGGQWGVELSSDGAIGIRATTRL